MICLTSANKNQTEDQDAAIDRCISEIATGGPSGANAAMRELYALTSSSVYGFALSILKNSYDAEDVLHDCYVLIYSAAAGYRSAGKPMAWILTIAKNLSLKKLREGGRNAGISPEEAESSLTLSLEASMEDRAIVAACLKKLSDEERQIVVLHAVSGFKHRETAEFLKLPLPTVLSKYHRALKKLRAIL